MDWHKMMFEKGEKYFQCSKVAANSISLYLEGM
jgi:hypothetical protein